MRAVNLAPSQPGFAFPVLFRQQSGARVSLGAAGTFSSWLCSSLGTWQGTLTSRSSSSPAEREPGLRHVEGCFPCGPDGCFL